MGATKTKLDFLKFSKTLSIVVYTVFKHSLVDYSGFPFSSKNFPLMVRSASNRQQKLIIILQTFASDPVLKISWSDPLRASSPDKPYPWKLIFSSRRLQSLPFPHCHSLRVRLSRQEPRTILAVAQVPLFHFTFQVHYSMGNHFLITQLIRTTDCTGPY